MSEDKPPPKATAGIFANARASAAKNAGAVGAGMHNTLRCGRCGAPREHGPGGAVDPALVCRYCATPYNATTP